MTGVGERPIPGGGDHVNRTLQAMMEVAKDEKLELSAEQYSSAIGFRESVEEAINPFVQLRMARKDMSGRKNKIAQVYKSGDKSSRLLAQKISQTADQFQKRNPELRAPRLVRLREQLNPDDTADEILDKVLDFFEDVALADEALEFLEQTTDGDLSEQVRQARETLNKDKGREISAGRNIQQEAQAAAGRGIGSAGNLRDLYRDITGNPRDSTTLFSELSSKYSYQDLKKVIDFMLHALGADTKAKGPSISHALLHRLMTETRSMQAILGVYRFFRGRMHLMHDLFAKNGLTFPSQLNFESMTKQFMNLASDRYPTSNKALQGTGRLGIEKWIMAKIIALSQFRDAVKEVAVNQIYKSLQHRDDLYAALIEALEELENLLEEQEDEEQRRRDQEEEEDEEKE